MAPKKCLVTSALPYANGPLHFGHLAGAYIPADVFVRHKRMEGVETKFISGSDEHGVAIELNAKKQGRSFQEYVDEWHNEHKSLFDQYDVEFDFFGQTSKDYHREEVIKWFEALHKNGLIGTKDNQQLYCNDCNNHLPDRYVQGTCYKCGYEHARGDECPHCGEWIEPEKLIEPVCQICESKNVSTVTVTQYYLLLTKFEEPYKKWLSTKEWWRKTVFPYVESLTKEGLVDRAISRDLEWGIDVPLAEAKGKKLYVWFDAPIGYVSNLKKHFEEIGSKDDYISDWWKNDDTEIFHFIGKDNIIFHTVIFPVMAMGSDQTNPPHNVPANMYVNLEGKQFSKSSGWYVDAFKAIEQFGVDALRYYLINIIPENADSSFTWNQFQARVNNELANNIGNFVNRCLKFWNKNWKDGLDGKFFSEFTKSDAAKELVSDLQAHRELLDNVQIRRGLEKVMEIGAKANNFFSDRAPWAQIKTDESEAAKTIAESGMYLFTLTCILSPYLPTLSKKIQSFFGDIDQSIQARVYQGDLTALDEFFGSGLTLTGTPKILVPKIEDDVIKVLNEELAKLS